MDDIAYLITTSQVATDSEGNIIDRIHARQVFCKIESVTRREFYDAATQDIEPEFEMIISHRIDYDGERLVMYGDRLYDVIRTYWRGEEVTLTLARAVGTQEDREAVLIMPDGTPVTFVDGLADY